MGRNDLCTLFAALAVLQKKCQAEPTNVWNELVELVTQNLRDHGHEERQVLDEITAETLPDLIKRNLSKVGFWLLEKEKVLELQQQMQRRYAEKLAQKETEKAAAKVAKLKQQGQPQAPAHPKKVLVVKKKVLPPNSR